MSRSKRDYEQHCDNVQDLPGYDDWLNENRRQVTEEDMQRMFEQQHAAPARDKTA